MIIIVMLNKMKYIVIILVMLYILIIKINYIRKDNSVLFCINGI